MAPTAEEEEEMDLSDSDQNVSDNENQKSSSSDESEDDPDPDDLVSDDSDILPEPETTKKGTGTGTGSSSNMVVAVYEGQWFPAEVCPDQSGVPKGQEKLSYMQMKGVGMGLGTALNLWAWPEKKDILITPKEDVLLRNVGIEPRNNRGCFSLKISDHKKVLSLMVGFICSLLVNTGTCTGSGSYLTPAMGLGKIRIHIWIRNSGK
ncbi:MAG: hypothetical protein FJ333_09115 [Sphingomonadales bacterium]|nr:hypothetical protein [Sphingomonadales bacterium]